MTYQDTVLEINLKNLKHNYDYLRSKLKPRVKLLAVIKAFGYGTDSCFIALHLLYAITSPPVHKLLLSNQCLIFEVVVR